MDYLISLGVSISLGLIIGLEREFRLVSRKDRFAGIRTFPLVAILGATTGLVSQSTSPWVLAVMSGAIVLFTTLTYYVRSSAGHPGITTEVALMITFVLGAMCSLDLIQEALAAAVITATFLSLKDVLHSFVTTITREELFAFIKFTVLSLVLLPFLPDEGFGPGSIINPKGICLVIVTISMLSFASYIIMKLAGASKGVILSSVLGGLISSTAVTWIFSAKTQTATTSRAKFAAGIVIASSLMPLRISLVTLIFTTPIFPQIIWPSIVMSIVGSVAAAYILKANPDGEIKSDLELGNPLSLSSALYSTLLYIGVLFVVFYGKQWFGPNGLMVSGIISGLVDLDAIAIALSGVVETTSHAVPVLILLAAMISNTALKIAVVLIKGHPAIRMRVVIGLLLTAVVAGISMVILSL